MNINIDFYKVFQEYAKDKIKNLGYLKADIVVRGEQIEGVTYKVNYIDSVIREISPAYCVSPAEMYEDENISNYINEQNKDIKNYYGDDSEGLIVCKKEDDRFKVKYNMGQMVESYYPLLANMTFTDIDKSYYDEINTYWNEISCDEVMLSGIETELSIGNGSGDGLLKEAVLIYQKMDFDFNTKEIKELASNYRNLFSKYGTTIQSIDTLYKIANSDTKITKSKYKNAVLGVIKDIDNLSINNEKLSLSEKEKIIKPIKYELEKVEHKANSKKKNKEAR